MDPLYPAKLAFRALEDLHTIAEAARGRSAHVDRLEAAADRIVETVARADADLRRADASLDVIAETAEPLQGAAERVGRWVKPKR